jgi:hypothetical protein
LALFAGFMPVDEKCGVFVPVFSRCALVFNSSTVFCCFMVITWALS